MLVHGRVSGPKCHAGGLLVSLLGHTAILLCMHVVVYTGPHLVALHRTVQIADVRILLSAWIGGWKDGWKEGGREGEAVHCVS